MGNNRFIKLLPDMAVFVRVVETGSFSAAALELGLTPSAVSRQVTRLEQSLSVRLLERTTRKLRLSEPGKEAYRDCQKMVAAAKSAMDVAQQFVSLPQGLIRVSMPKAFGKTVISPLMPAFLQQYPEVDVQLILTDRQPDLNNDDVDLAIYMTDNPPDGVVARPLMQVTQVLCATPRYLAEHGTPDHPGALSGHNCIYLGETANDAEWHFRRGGETTTIKVHGRYIANHSGVRLDGILQHLGIGCLPHFTATAALEEGLIVRVLTDWEFLAAYQGTAFLQYLPNRYMALKMRVFIDYLTLHLHSSPDHSADSLAQS
ncbi:LysR family transcriptional regulator [Glaciimonas sp. PCH181]|uniref:LysR family transcriptional regulator n=1 Tax=Glaciimonas sp. PCH181 TaxID=2133943 RepID=UPI001CED65E2|nr:LysR family transcriptional regulator [Glaciimonas sp. PCH181]